MSKVNIVLGMNGVIDLSGNKDYRDGVMEVLAIGDKTAVVPRGRGRVLVGGERLSCASLKDGEACQVFSEAGANWGTVARIS